MYDVIEKLIALPLQLIPSQPSGHSQWSPLLGSRSLPSDKAPHTTQKSKRYRSQKT
jgi:hypothetical protein